jgi:hypothetical protein
MPGAAEPAKSRAQPGALDLLEGNPANPPQILRKSSANPPQGTPRGTPRGTATVAKIRESWSSASGLRARNAAIADVLPAPHLTDLSATISC